MCLCQKFWGYLSYITTNALVILLGISMTGCGDSSDSSELKESARLLSAAQQHILASHEQVALTEQDMARGKASAKRLAERLDGINAAETDAALEELNQMLEKLQAGDTASLRAISQGLIALSDSFLETHRQGNPHSVAAYRKRIKQAKQALNESSRLSKSSGYTQDQVGPALMQGTLHLMIARDLRSQLSSIELQTQSEQMALGRLAMALVEERTYGAGLPDHFPYEATVGELNNRLDGDSATTGEPESLQSQLDRARERIKELTSQQLAARVELERYTSMAKENLQLHLELLEQAEQARGDKKYALKQQAYALRDGGKEGESQSGLVYEAKVELLENQLAVLEKQLAFARLQEGQLVDMIEQVNLSVEELTNSPIQAEIATHLEQSQKRVAEITQLLEAQLERIKAIDTAYRTIRLEAVTAYQDSQQAFSQAQRLARDDRKSRDYAKRMAGIVQAELAGATKSDIPEDEEAESEDVISTPETASKRGLWEMDLKHYESLAETMEYLENADAAGGIAKQLRQEFQGQAQQALQSISEPVGQP